MDIKKNGGGQQQQADSSNESDQQQLINSQENEAASLSTEPRTANETPLTFKAQEDNSSVKFNWASGSNVKYSTDGLTWNDYTQNTEIQLNNNETVSFKGSNVTTTRWNKFTMAGKIAASGDVTSLTNETGGDAELTNSCYQCMFYNCPALTTAPALPATTLAESCYNHIFSDCTALTTAPALPATTLAESCYSYIFSNCTALTTAPALPATTLAESCYINMFNSCKALTTAPVLPATTLAKSCYKSMFYNCTALTTAPALPATTLAESCYDEMFKKCTALTTAPALPATTLVEFCYLNMFNNCTALTTAPALPATTLATSCYKDMFFYCTALTTAPALPATTLATSCYKEMFYYCTALTTAPALPATTLAEACYNAMFYICTALTTAPVLPATTLAKFCYTAMFSKCSSLTTAPELPVTTLEESCYSSMFNECSSLTTAPELPATTLINNCYQMMFRGCSSLQAPAMLDNVDSLAQDCCRHMYHNCTGLNIYTTKSQTGYEKAWKATNVEGASADSWANNMFSGCGGDAPTITSATTYYIKNDPFTVDFDVQDFGTAPSSQKIYLGSKVTKPVDPTDTNNDFIAWYKDKSCENAWNFDSDTVQADTTLYAKWSAKQQYRDAACTTIDTYATTQTNAINAIEDLTESEKEGYVAQINTAQLEGKENVANAQTSLDVDTAKTSAKTSMNTILANANEYASKKAEPSTGDFIFTAPSDLVYSGTAKEASVTGKDGMGSITLHYYNAAGSKLTGAPINVGSYQVKIDVAAGSKYKHATNLSESSWTFSISAKPVTVTAVDKKMNLGDDVPAFSAEVNGTVGTDKVSYNFNTIEPKAQGAYTIVVNGAANQGNYSVSYVSGTLIVNAPASEVSANPEDLAKILSKYREDRQYTGKTLDVVLKTDGEIPQTDKDAIAAKAGADKKLMYSPADLILIIQDTSGTTEQKNIGSENNTLIAVTYQFDFTKKDDIQTLRCHNGVADEITETPNTDGEFVKYNKDASTITVSAKKYSTYSVAYNEVQDPSPTPQSETATNNGSLSTVAKTGDNIGITAGVLAAAALCAAGLLTFMRRKNNKQKL